MSVRLHFWVIFLVFSHLFFVQTRPCLGQHSPKETFSLLARNEEGASANEDSKEMPPKVIEQYEKERLAKMEQNVGRRLMTAPATNPMEFYKSPDDLEKKIRVKGEKEGFIIEKVVQNHSGTMNFYQVKFDSGKTGYLAADGNNLEIRIEEGSLISVQKKASTVGRGSSQSKVRASQAVDLVKHHGTLTDPATGRKRSVEMRMIEKKAQSFPNLEWRYEAKEIGKNIYRVTQYSREEAGPPLTRTWIVDLSTTEVNPENLAAKEMYRQ